MSDNTFTLELDGFKGPLELLLNLIEKHKLQVNDIALAAISDEYIAYIENKERIPLSETAQFVTIAATLLLLKSRSLIPTIAITTEEDDAINDLQKRLEKYAQVRHAVRLLRTVWKKRTYTPMRLPQKKVIFTPATSITTKILLSQIQEIVQTLPIFVQKPTATVVQEIRLEDVIHDLASRMQRITQSSFETITNGTSRINAIVHFLAILELVKDGTLETTQNKHFADILLQHDTITTPHYE